MVPVLTLDVFPLRPVSYTHLDVYKRQTPQPPKATAVTTAPAETDEEITSGVIIDKNDLNLTPLKKYNSSATINKVDKLISIDLNKRVSELSLIHIYKRRCKILSRHPLFSGLLILHLRLLHYI